MEDAVPAEGRLACRDRDLPIFQLDRLGGTPILVDGDRDSGHQDVLRSHGQQEPGAASRSVSSIDASGSRVPWTANLARSGGEAVQRLGDGDRVEGRGRRQGRQGDAEATAVTSPRFTMKASKQREASRRTR